VHSVVRNGSKLRRSAFIQFVICLSCRSFQLFVVVNNARYTCIALLLCYYCQWWQFDSLGNVDGTPRPVMLTINTFKPPVLH